MFQVMRIPLYPRNATEKDAYPMFTVETKEEANQICELLTDFVMNPPPPMESVSNPHHFVKEI